MLSHMISRGERAMLLLDVEEFSGRGSLQSEEGNEGCHDGPTVYDSD